MAAAQRQRQHHSGPAGEDQVDSDEESQHPDAADRPAGPHDDAQGQSHDPADQGPAPIGEAQEKRGDNSKNAGNDEVSGQQKSDHQLSGFGTTQEQRAYHNGQDSFKNIEHEMPVLAMPDGVHGFDYTADNQQPRDHQDGNDREEDRVS